MYVSISVMNYRYSSAVLGKPVGQQGGVLTELGLGSERLLDSKWLVLIIAQGGVSCTMLGFWIRNLPMDVIILMLLPIRDYILNLILWG